MPIHTEPSEFAGTTVQVDIGRGGIEDYHVEDYWDRVSGGSWMYANGNPAALNYAMRTTREIPLDDEVLYGKIGAFGYLVHVSEIRA